MSKNTRNLFLEVIPERVNLDKMIVSTYDAITLNGHWPQFSGWAGYGFPILPSIEVNEKDIILFITPAQKNIFDVMHDEDVVLESWQQEESSRLDSSPKFWSELNSSSLLKKDITGIVVFEAGTEAYIDEFNASMDVISSRMIEENKDIIFGSVIVTNLPKGYRFICRKFAEEKGKSLTGYLHNNPRLRVKMIVRKEDKEVIFCNLYTEGIDEAMNAGQFYFRSAYHLTKLKKIVADTVLGMCEKM